ncbi:MAG: hypothetical protein WBD55_11695, partial [Dehalococcoidia bacterium]
MTDLNDLSMQSRAGGQHERYAGAREATDAANRQRRGTGMHIHRRLLLAALTSAFLLVALASSALASRSIQVEPSGAITVTAPATFISSPAGQRLTALVTLRGNLARVISKATGSLAGQITDCRSTLGEAGLIVIRVEIRCELLLPWHIRYSSFAGSLPRPVLYLLIFLNIGFSARDLAGGASINCL